MKSVMELLKLSKLRLQLQSLITEVRDLRVSYLQNDNALLEMKQKELKGTLNNLLQSRENFVHDYQESNSQMKHSIKTKDKMIFVLSEKINSHLLLFDLIEKEAFNIKQIVDKVQTLVSHKEEIENISDLRNKLESSEAGLRKKDRVISELKANLDAAKLSHNNQVQIEDISLPTWNCYMYRIP
ncbi:hypothetical protein TanjilG_15888 [Lupinus angustifolius]|uniref:Uncharacterized protein n=1 Tax=Lupinus angustifolius TaxID=3871 RepID=A0A4P1RGT0_LUPAN|nr:hypothetical protein TanjilG_15888 [Lupinus angustifolius]